MATSPIHEELDVIFNIALLVLSKQACTYELRSSESSCAGWTKARPNRGEILMDYSVFFLNWCHNLSLQTPGVYIQVTWIPGGKIIVVIIVVHHSENCQCDVECGA